MPDQIPTLNLKIDNAFVTTWYDIRQVAIDNILNATPVWAVLNNAGAFTEKNGGTLITRTISYGTTPAVAVQRGDLLPSGEEELETMAIWKWRAIASRVQRSIFDDQENRGDDMIKSLVGTKLKAAKDGMEQKFESSMFNAFDGSESSKEFQGLNDLVPDTKANATVGTYGSIARPSAYITAPDNANLNIPDPAGSNHWWGSKYLDGVYANLATDLVNDLRTLYNALKNNQIAPNLILTTEEIFEEYEDQALGLSQLLKREGGQAADLGFDELLFKGKPMIWTDNMPSKQVLMLNTDFMEVVFDPGYWFDMTDWKPGQLEDTRIAHILSFANLIGTQPRRNGRLIYV